MIFSNVFIDFPFSSTSECGFQCIFDNLDLIQPRIQHKAWSQMANIWKNDMAQLMLEGGDAQESMEKMAEEIDDVLGDS